VTYEQILLSSISKYVPGPPPILSSYPTQLSPYPIGCRYIVLSAPYLTANFLRNHRYGIIIEQNYDGGDLKGTATSGIPITNLILNNVQGVGAVSSSGYDVVITCGSGACGSGWKWTDVNVTGGKKYASCTNVPSGFACS
jgi:hypothetical protein